MMTERLLIVSADDFGLTDGVCRGILSAGITSVSVLALGPALDRWAGALADSGLGVGLHVAFVGEDPPLLSAAELSTVLDRRGRLPASWGQLLPRVAAGRVDVAELEREARAQLERVRSLGLGPDHLDGHQHVQLWPSLGQMFLRIATSEQIAAVRTPDSAASTPRGVAVRMLARPARARVRAAGLVTTDRFAGLDEAGGLAQPVLASVLGRLIRAEWSSAELNAHPGIDPDPGRERYRWRYRWAEEHAALASPGWRAQCAQAGIRLGTYADLVGAGPTSADPR